MVYDYYYSREETTSDSSSHVSSASESTFGYSSFTHEVPLVNNYDRERDKYRNNRLNYSNKESTPYKESRDYYSSSRRRDKSKYHNQENPPPPNNYSPNRPIHETTRTSKRQPPPPLALDSLRTGQAMADMASAVESQSKTPTSHSTFHQGLDRYDPMIQPLPRIPSSRVELNDHETRPTSSTKKRIDESRPKESSVHSLPSHSEQRKSNMIQTQLEYDMDFRKLKQARPLVVPPPPPFPPPSHSFSSRSKSSKSSKSSSSSDKKKELQPQYQNQESPSKPMTQTAYYPSIIDIPRPLSPPNIQSIPSNGECSELSSLASPSRARKKIHRKEKKGGSGNGNDNGNGKSKGKGSDSNHHSSKSKQAPQQAPSRQMTPQHYVPPDFNISGPMYPSVEPPQQYHPQPSQYTYPPQNHHPMGDPGPKQHQEQYPYYGNGLSVISEETSSIEPSVISRGNDTSSTTCSSSEHGHSPSTSNKVDVIASNQRSKALQQIMTEMEELYEMRSKAVHQVDIQFWDSQIKSLQQCIFRICEDTAASAAKHGIISGKDSSRNEQQYYGRIEDNRMSQLVNVRAPADLPPGHSFIAKMNGRSIIAVVVSIFCFLFPFL